MDQVALYQDNNSIETPTNDTPQNYTILISKLEQLALGLNTDLENLASLGKKHLAIAFNEDIESAEDLSGEYITATSLHHAAGGGGGGSDTPIVSHMPDGMTEAEYNRVVSDIWIGVILTLLIVTVIFFICSCFLYHKFQQWKNSYRTNDALDPSDVIRRYDLDVESLPSYTIVSGLPTYDDALEEFRKAGIILKPHMPVVKIFDRGTKESAPPSGDDLPEYTPPTDNAASGGPACICGAVGALQPNQVIELNPEHLQMLSQKRLSLQISFNGQPAAIRRNSRSRVDLCTQVSRNNLWRATMDQMPEIHRSSSLTFDNERSVVEHRLRKLGHHRGSIS